MRFLADNWFFIAVVIGFFLMMSGHGGCGGHHRHGTQDGAAPADGAHLHHHES